jgi:hypothetical protein
VAKIYVKPSKITYVLELDEEEYDRIKNCIRYQTLCNPGLSSKSKEDLEQLYSTISAGGYRTK